MESHPLQSVIHILVADRLLFFVSGVLIIDLIVTARMLFISVNQSLEGYCNLLPIYNVFNPRLNAMVNTVTMPGT